MNKTQLKKIIKEELQAALDENKEPAMAALQNVLKWSSDAATSPDAKSFKGAGFTDEASEQLGSYFPDDDPTDYEGTGGILKLQNMIGGDPEYPRPINKEFVQIAIDGFQPPSTMPSWRYTENKMNKAQIRKIIKEMLDMSLVTTETSPSGQTIHKLPMDILQGAVETGRLIAQNPELLDYVMNNVQAGDRVMGQRCEDCTSDGDDIMDGKDVLRMVDYATKTADSEGGPASAEEMDRWESDYRDERPSPFSPEDIEKMRAYKPPTQTQKDAWESDYFKESKMNKTNIKQLVKETLEATLNEDQWLEQGATGELEHIASELERAAEAMASAPTHDTPDRYANAIFKLAKQLRYAMDALSGRNPGGSIGEVALNEFSRSGFANPFTAAMDALGGSKGSGIGEAHDKEWAAMSSDEQSQVDALTSIEHEADGLEKGANVMIKGHEMGRQLDNNAIGKVILNMANKIRGHVKRHREEMSMPGW